MKRFCNAFAVLMAALCTASTANALPLVWRADWPDAKPVETLVHRGADIELQPTWYINKEAANTNGWTFTTYCQTNAVGPWFGPLPGAFFSHTNDVGAASYNVMVRAQMPGGAVNYTAFARLRMLDSPGFAPGELPLPVSTIDFSKVVAINAPWLLPGATNDIGAIKVELGAISNSVSTLSAATATNSAGIATINSKIPSAASQSNQLADKEWIDDEIDTYAAYYITYTAAGAAFPTRAALLNATVVYSGGAARTPTRNDYAVVLADESQGGAEWRYIYTVAAGATSGQWDAQYPIETNDYDALANKPQINGNTLTGEGSQTGASLGLLDLAGNQDYSGTVNLPNAAIVAGDIITKSSIDFSPQLGGDSKSLSAPENSGKALTDADISDSSSALGAVLAGKADSAMIDANNTTFSNAVLSVGLGIDTDTVAVINELVDSAHDLPVTGATSVGALLLALAAAVAALKKKFGYDTPAAITASAQLADRTNNRVEPTQGSAAIALTFPDAVAGKGRDFLVLVSPGANYSGTISFTTPANATIYGDGFGATIAAGESWLFSVTEIASNVFYTRAQKMEVPS